MEIKFYNSLTNKVETFTPIKENEVSIYVCGPTVYNYPHIGNIRPVVFFDTLRKFLEALNYKVTYVTNFTDVDDKIINRAIEENITEKELTDFYINDYLKIFESINCKSATKYCRVSECMDEIIDYIDDLVKSNDAYVNEGEVFFDVKKDDEYGILSKININDLIDGARIEVNNKKKSPLDFLLWKNTNVGIKWDSPWGKGRPGWHTECCVMINKTFNGKIDIHGGGSDLKFPHHENEIAQSHAHDHHNLANYWIHNAMMDINGNKMSKSLGNVILAKDVIKEYGPNLTRLMLINAPYRANINFNDETIKNNQAILNKIESLVKQMNLYLGMKGFILEGKGKRIDKFLLSLSNDMNIPNGITDLLELIKEGNTLLRNKEKNDEEILDIFYSIRNILDILGLKFDIKNFNEEEKSLYNEYLEAKNNKDFEKSDKLREKLIELNIL